MSLSAITSNQTAAQTTGASPPTPPAQPEQNPSQQNGAASSTTVSNQSGQPNREDQQAVKNAVDKINGMMQSSNQDVKFSIDKSTGRIVIKVMDMQNNQVIKQIPSKEVLAIAQQIDSFSKGLLVKITA